MLARLVQGQAVETTSLTVLNNRELKLKKVEMERLWSMHGCEAAKADSYKAHFKAAQMRGFAKDVTIARLQRMLAEAKKA